MISMVLYKVIFPHWKKKNIFSDMHNLYLKLLAEVENVTHVLVQRVDNTEYDDVIAEDDFED